MEKQIIYYYKRGVASYLIAKKFGVSNNYVRNILKSNGIEPRGHRVTNKMSARRRTPEENKKITQAASESNVGSVHSASHRARLAKSREKNPSVDPTYEKPLLDTLKKMGIAAIPQKAFGKYNVDIYLPHHNVVIEIFGGGFHNKKDAVRMFNNKLKHLSNKQVPVVVVWADKLTFSPSAVVKVSVVATDKLTIISGDGQPTTRGMGNIVL